jgi:hypothetical protein
MPGIPRRSKRYVTKDFVALTFRFGADGNVPVRNVHATYRNLHANTILAISHMRL